MELGNEDINPYIISSSKLARNTCPPAGTSFGRRTVRWFELELIVWGEGRINTQGVDIPTEKGVIFFRKPGMVVEGFPPYSCYLIIFDMTYQKDRLSLYKDCNYFNAPQGKSCWLDEEYFFAEESCFNLPAAMNSTSFERLENLFDKSYLDFIRNPKEANIIFQKLLVLNILNILTQEKSRMTSDPTRSINNHLVSIKRVMGKIDNNPSKNYTLQSLASEANLSPNFFCSTFKKVAGVSPFYYLNSARIRMATRLLIETLMPIKEIASLCGFENETYFFTTFKRLQGQTPQVYRKSFYWSNPVK